LILTLMLFMLSFGRDLIEKEYGTQGNTGAFPCPVDQLPLTGWLAMPRFLPPSSITSSIGTTC
ncbi:MAG: hypothetical protein ABL936_25605, partial [Aestuariivirga sp.]